ncbi:hypothetical protein V2I68_22785 [Pseudomonas viridiflava]|uniref:Uncharacterized protein n=1 Tax=Pseudomonas viridiflava TaxID=33069 RepID=A0ABU7NDN0_PSEVI|nr:hypothetical protein [Pseudomonas viridiflava]MEE3938386.1 hypothetical protein [Pseudomonas viridiflava]MEE4043039.1 hypothetical protein [Pseudomonas viridiflava]MEE4062831.1 hypothetical protein [Pseudomonas viridiflava]MEE4172181.1 hypothetical protein [Pseudomonas viridiflava]
MSNECKVLSIEPTQEMLDAITTERKKGNGALQCWYAAFAAAPQPPALGGVPAGLDLQRIVTEALMGMIAAMTSTSPPANEPPPPFIQAGIDRAVSRISAHLAPLQAEIERLKAELAWSESDSRKQAAEIDQFKVRCDELEKTIDLNPCGGPVCDGDPDSCEKNEGYGCKCSAALSKPAGSEQESSLEIPSRTIKLSGCEFTEDDLLRRAVRAVGGSRRNTLPRWALVRDAFGCGSGVGTALCRRFGFDPEEILKA